MPTKKPPEPRAHFSVQPGDIDLWNPETGEYLAETKSTPLDAAPAEPQAEEDPADMRKARERLAGPENRARAAAVARGEPSP